MAEGRADLVEQERRSDWQRTAELLAMTHNTHVPGSTATSRDFNPCADPKDADAERRQRVADVLGGDS